MFPTLLVSSVPHTVLTTWKTLFNFRSLSKCFALPRTKLWLNGFLFCLAAWPLWPLIWFLPLLTSSNGNKLHKSYLSPFNIVTSSCSSFSCSPLWMTLPHYHLRNINLPLLPLMWYYRSVYDYPYGDKVHKPKALLIPILILCAPF